MDKKTKTIVIIVLAIAVIGGLCYGYNRWRQQRLANQILKEMYGVNTGLLGGLTNNNSGKLQEQIAKELAKQAAIEEAKQKADEAKEAAKTPEDRFNETKSITLTGKASSLIKDNVEPRLTAIFGKIKPTLFNNGYTGQENSFLIVFKIPRVPTSEDFNKLIEEFTNNGYTSAMNSVGADSANLMFDKDTATVNISYENSTEQEVGVLYMEKTNQ